MKLATFCFLVCVCATAAPAAPPVQPQTIKAGWRDAQFQQAAPYSSPDEVHRRFRGQARMPGYDITKERFRILVPEGYSTQTNWGLFVWVSPGDSPDIPADWEGALARQRLLFIGAYNGGNGRSAFDRFRLAVDASLNMRQRFRIDPKRIYVSGFSGGGRVASMLGVAYADIFTGSIPICGVNFYTALPAEDGKQIDASYLPDTSLAALARSHRHFALITGERDINRLNTRSAYENGFKKAGFAHVLYLEVPGLGHAIPSAEWLEKAVEFLSASGAPAN
jgi:predicted esterase